MKIKSLLDCMIRQPMSEEQTRIMMMSMMAEMGGDEAPQELKDLDSVRIMRQRLKFAEVEASDWTLFFLSSLCINPAMLVMYAYVCTQLYRKHKEEIKMSHISEAFPTGFPVESEVRKCWDSQKGEFFSIVHEGLTDNYLDSREPWVA
jgi:hypothetical protein